MTAIPASWRRALPADAAALGKDLLARVRALRAEQDIYPPQAHILRALELTPFEAVRVVVLGQDPYHGPGQAHGLAFSVPQGQKTPPSLRNIFKEIDACLPRDTPREQTTDLTRWAEQGVLLLNTTLTVQAGKPASHANLGWQAFTDACIAALNRNREGLAFLLWGAHAQAKAPLVDPARHLVLQAAHPSPFSAHRGFLGCAHFARANAHLASRGEPPIHW